MSKQMFFLLLALCLMGQTPPDDHLREAVRQRLLSSPPDLQATADLQAPQGFPINPLEIHAEDAQMDNFFGSSIAVDGDTMVVGATGDSRAGGQESGSAYIFVWDGQQSTWVQQAKLTTPDAEPLDYFGSEVAISGDIVVIGAHGRDSVTESNAGVAFVYARDGVNWNLQATLLPTFEVTGYGGDFGFSLAVDGDTIVVGAPYLARLNINTNTVYTGAGKAWVFKRNGNAWDVEGELTGPLTWNVNFGISVAIEGDTIAIGGQGVSRAYIFTRAAGVWTQQAEIAPPPGQQPGMFGRSVAVDGNTLAVGAPRDNPSALTGAVFLYERSAGTWTFDTRLDRGGYTCCRLLGQEVALQGDTLVAGASDDAAFVFSREAGEWAGPLGFTMGAGITFGAMVDTDGGKVYVTASSADLPGVDQAGVAYAFDVIPASDLVVAMVDSVDAVQVGAGLAYAVGVWNSGPDRVTNVEWSVNLPPDYQFSSMDAPPELGCVHQAGVITCSVGSMAYDEIIIFEIYGIAGFDGGTISASTTAISNDRYDPFLPNNTTIEITTANAPLPSPQPLTPADTAIFQGERPAFSWRSVSTAIGYVVEVGDALPLSRDTVVYQGAANHFTIANPLLPGTYYWRVRAYGSALPSAWSDVIVFDVVSAPNGAPRRNYFTTHDVSLGWGTLTATGDYQVEIATDKDIRSVIVRATVSGSSEIFSIAGNGVYYWRVRALPDGKWSAVEQFTVDVP